MGDTEIGMGNTNAWSMGGARFSQCPTSTAPLYWLFPLPAHADGPCHFHPHPTHSGLDEDTTLALYFEVTAQPSGASGQSGGGQRYLQILTSYQHSSGQYRLRVSTLARPWAEASQIAEIARGFDQEAAAVLMARIASHKTQTEEVSAASVLGWRHAALGRVLTPRTGDCAGVRHPPVDRSNADPPSRQVCRLSEGRPGLFPP